MTVDECKAEIVARYMDGLTRRIEAVWQLIDYCEFDRDQAEVALPECEEG